MRTVNLYGGRVNITFDEEKHVFTLEDGTKPLSVTGALSIINKPQLIPWAVGLARDHLKELVDQGKPVTGEDIETACKLHYAKKKEAAGIGQMVHDWVERHIVTGGDELPDDESILNGVLGFLRWKKHCDVTFLANEIIVYSKEHSYVGIADAVGTIDGKRCLFEWKTSSGMYPEFDLQAAAYVNAWNEEHPSEPIQERVIARFDKKTGDFEYKHLKHLGNDVETFLSALRLSTWHKRYSKG